MPEGNLFYRFMHKRKSFEHEREVRALIQDLPYKPDPEGSAASVFNYDICNTEAGRIVPIQLLDLVEKVYIAPTAPPWFRDIVTRITAKYEIDMPVEQSAMGESPEL